ncbi:MAG: peptidylprolyl isomerase [Deltaproteobacteria bacterium]|nr:peptidylprolyl isomerase [Deltaproteobacteria bacterium]
MLALAGCRSSIDAPQHENAGHENTAEHAAAENAGTHEQPDENAHAQANAAPHRPAQPSDIPAPPDVAAPPANVQRTASGLASRVITPGEGTDHPAAEDRVHVHYTGWTTNGHMFDSSVARGNPVDFPLNRVIPGWTEGVQLMVKGEKRRFWIPANLAYGEHPRPGAPQGMLVFDIELLDFTPAPQPPTVPPDVAAIPADAQRTASGLASRVLIPGEGTEHPTAQNRVTVHYSGWTTDGHMFDSSIMRGQPATFPLTGVIAGWTEGVQLMVKGETRRFWIPANLAYGENPRPGQPRGMLVFDIQLVDFH